MPVCKVFLLVAVFFLGVCHSKNCSFNDVLESLNFSSLPGTDVRPVKDWRTKSIVYLDLFLYTVINLDTSTQTLSTFIWFYMEWQNEFIKWNPDDFCGIKTLYASGDKFWKPDLYIYEMTETDDKSPVIPYYILQSNGKITNSKPLRIISTCNLDIYKFPFDIQRCDLTFGPYVHSVSDIIMLPKKNSSQVSEGSKEVFVGKGDWALVDITVDNKTLISGGEEFSQVVYRITIKRAPVVYLLNLIIPSCFLVLLDIASMFIQTGTQERLGFKITIVLGFSVLLLILNDILPNSDNPPVLDTDLTTPGTPERLLTLPRFLASLVIPLPRILAIYLQYIRIFCCVCLAIMVLSILGSICATYMLTLSNTKPQVPSWVRIWIMKHLARVLCFRLESKDADLVTLEGVNNNVEDIKRPDTNIEVREKVKMSFKESKGNLEVKLLKRLLAEVLKIHRGLILSKSEDEAKSEWHIAALIVDRLVLIVYLIILVIMFSIVIAVWAS